MDEKCIWTQEQFAEFNIWNTSCKNTFEITEGSPSQNNMKYCPYCSKEIDEYIVNETKTKN